MICLRRALECIPVSTCVCPLVVVVSDTSDNDGSNGPEHLQHLGSGSSQLNGCNLTAVGRCVGNEDSPWKTLEKLGDEHDGERVGKVEDEDEGVQGHQSGNGRPAVSNAAGKGTSQTHADNGTKGTTHLEGRLPASHNDPLVVDRAVDTVLLGEGGEGNKVSHQEDTVRLHDLEAVLAGILQEGGGKREVTDNGAGHDKGPQSSHGVGGDGLGHAHVVLSILGLDGSGLVLDSL